MDPFADILGGLFGRRGGGAKAGPKKAKPVLTEIKIKLEDAYNGKVHKLDHTR